MQNDAVTLLEILIVIIMVAVLTAIGVPVYTNRIERTRGERAIANIELIKDALKMYRIKYDTEPVYPIDTLPNINTNLDLDLADTFFDYRITNIAAPNYRRIQALRNGGIYDDRRIWYHIDPVDGTPDNWATGAGTSNWPWMP